MPEFKQQCTSNPMIQALLNICH